jgi:hypothetical protein
VIKGHLLLRDVEETLAAAGLHQEVVVTPLDETGARVPP